MPSLNSAGSISAGERRQRPTPRTATRGASSTRQRPRNTGASARFDATMTALTGGCPMPDLTTVPARKGKAAYLGRGERLRLINTHGGQVVDTWAFSRDDIHEFMSMEHSRAHLSKILPTAGDTMVSNRRCPILTFVEDTSGGVHDTLIAACDPRR